MNVIRIKQVLTYGWKHSGEITRSMIANQSRKPKGWIRILLFLDILRCFRKYRMWSNQYLNEKFWTLDTKSRDEIGRRYMESGFKRDKWQKDFQKDKKFYIKYGNVRYERANLRGKRNEAYAKRYNMGTGGMVEHSVEISRQHYLDGSIEMGNHVLLAKNVFIDYSGDVIIGDNVEITDGAHILSHDHVYHHETRSKESKQPEDDIKGYLEICEGVTIGTRSVILSSCHRIGKYARIGAGAVVTEDVPDYAIVAGVPAKLVRLMDKST